MKFKFVIWLSALFAALLVSCKDEVSAKKAAPKPEKPIFDYGFKLNDYNITRDTLKPGDNFGSILEKENIGTLKIHEIVEKIKDSFDIRKIRFGKTYTILRTKDSTKKVRALIYEPDPSEYFVVHFGDSVYAERKKRPVTIKRRTIAAELNGSLSEMLAKEKVNPALATEISQVYAWSIDFFKLQKGDRFAITFKERYINDSIYDGVASLDAAFFEYKGKLIYAFPFKRDSLSTKVEYYDEEGKPLKNMFLKAPLKFINITSRFAKSRFHPVQLTWKAHKGTDYAAPHGTPIMSTAAGVVEKTGYTAGNGNFVKVRHNRTYSTQYLHMSKILVRRGQSVSQGQIIGKVGSTGLATGPHVCYRFWVNNVQVDPLRLRLPNAEPMDKKYRERFLKTIAPLKRELDSVAKVKIATR
ncbi:peptidoglycan DD-metalloendopeptidase family protein [Flavobacterium sp.]|uniref:M23 family metallopeptidase n=1 Tax=Flavobacterium sp. TaxID=239 RepID=UPI002628449A|nr:peptidoglycan DD-metalloendopeptidase family protein [Flavobacterium sp.]